MKHQSDSSFLKSLAVALGDGLAFGVGMKIAQIAPKKRFEAAPVELLAPPVPATAAPPAESLDLQVLSKVIAALDAKLAQHMGKVEQRLTDAATNTAAELQSLESRQTRQALNTQDALDRIHASLTGRIETVEQDAHALEAKLAVLLESAVQTHIQEYVDERIQALEQRLHRDISEAGDRTAKLLVDTIENRMLDRIAMLEGQVRGQAETIRTLRAATHSGQQRLFELLAGFGRACQEAVKELEKPAEDKPEGGSGSGGADKPDSLKLVDYQGRSERKLPIPLVSSIAVLMLGLAALGTSVGWF
jgi:hypothetical protein